MGRFINQTEQKRLLKKLELKYGLRLRELGELERHEQLLYGYVTPDTEARKNLLIEKIKGEEKFYE